MKGLHIVPGLDEDGNGIAVTAKWIAAQKGDALSDARSVTEAQVAAADEIWVHSMCTPQTQRACWHTLRAGKTLVRMPHGNLDPPQMPLEMVEEDTCHAS